jgi:hypothetical protein
MERALVRLPAPQRRLRSNHGIHVEEAKAVQGKYAPSANGVENHRSAPDTHLNEAPHNKPHWTINVLSRKVKSELKTTLADVRTRYAPPEIKRSFTNNSSYCPPD